MARLELHATQLQTYMLCPRQFKYEVLEELQPRRANPKLFLGTHVHAGLAAYYRDPAGWLGGSNLVGLGAYDASAEQDLQEITARFGGLAGEEAQELYDAKELGKKVLFSYLEWCVGRDGNEFEVLEVEREFKVPILDLDGQDSGIDHVGRFDLIVRDKRRGWIWVLDHKTCRAFPNVSTIRTVPQFKLYTLAASYLYPGERIGGVIGNYLRKSDPARARTELFKRVEIPVEEYELAVWQRRVYRTASSIMLGAFMADGRTKEEIDEFFDPHPGPHCDWRCPFVSLCLGEDDGSDVEMLKANSFVKKGQVVGVVDDDE